MDYAARREIENRRRENKNGLRRQAGEKKKISKIYRISAQRGKRKQDI